MYSFGGRIKVIKVIAQKWIKIVGGKEVGFSFSIHRTPENLMSFKREYFSSLPGEYIPNDRYSKFGESYETTVDEETFQSIKGFGIRLDYPPEKPPA